MDKVRLGRAFGVGTRAMAKTLVEVSKAAAAPDPRAPEPRAMQTPQPPPVRTASAAQTAGRAVREAGRRKGAFLGPLRRFSGVLWLEVTGFFFGVFTCIMGNQIWKHRAAARLPPANLDAQHFYTYCFFCLLFLYFAVSSFVRARRRERR